MQSIEAWAPDDSSQDGWAANAETNAYVQVSRFHNSVIPLNDPTVEDYWFLIVNRRALAEEHRKIRLTVEIDTTFVMNPYYADYILGDSAKVAGPCGESRYDCRTRWIDVILDPGEAELVHFYRGEFGCDTTYAHIEQVTAHRNGQDAVRLSWERIAQTDDADPFNVGGYFVCGAPRSGGPYTPIAFTTDTTFVDSVFYSVQPHYFYVVQACSTETR